MDALDRLYFELVENLRREHRTALREPVSIADLQGRLIPYRKVRDAVDFRSNDEYAATLSRLLAGEREYLIVDPVVREDLRRALNDPLPDIRRYRTHPDARVMVNPDTIPPPGDIRYAPPEVRDLATQAAELSMEPAEDAPRHADGAGSEEIEVGEVGTPATEQGGPEGNEPTGTASEGEERSAGDDAATRCPECGEETPGDAAFCPFCGRRIGVSECPDCGIELKTEWSYCPGCGLRR